MEPTTQFCMPHFERLKKAIEDQALAPFVASTTEECKARLESALSDGVNLANYDPLAMIQVEVAALALELVGPGLMQPDANGEVKCPICCMVAVHDATCRDPKCGRVVFAALIDDVIECKASDVGERLLSLMPAAGQHQH